MLRRTRLAETPINVVVGVLLAGALAIVAQHLPGAQRACSTGASMQIRGDWALSPNEDEAAISLLSPTGQPLCLLNLATGVMKEVAHCGQCPSWSPMGAVIAFARVEKGGGRLELYSRKTGLRTKLPPSEGYEDRDPVWNQDATCLAFVRSPVEFHVCDSSLMIVSVRDGAFGSPNVVGQKCSAIQAPRWRPGRREVAYIASVVPVASDSKVRRDLHMVNLETGKTSVLSRTGNVTRSSLSWSPDGRYIAYGTDNAGTFESVRVAEIASGTSRTLLISDGIDRPASGIRTVQWSPDGKRILLGVEPRRQSPQAKWDIGLLDWPSGHFSWLTSDGESSLPRWSQDSSKVLYVRNWKEICSLDLHTMKRKTLACVSYSPHRP